MRNPIHRISFNIYEYIQFIQFNMNTILQKVFNLSCHLYHQKFATVLLNPIYTQSFVQKQLNLEDETKKQN